MVDFPNNPSDGDTHTEEGRTWVYQSPPNVWALLTGDSALPFMQSFHDPTGVASWRIVDDTLECWGTATPSGDTTVTVVFPKVFAETPTITSSVLSTSSRYSQVEMVTTTQARMIARSATANTARSDPTLWHAIGKWDGVS